MKGIFPIIVLAFFLASCQKDVTLPQERGFLKISSVEALSCYESALPTRAVDADLSVEVLTPEGKIILTLAAGSAAASKKIELDPGSYTLKAFSSSYGTLPGNGEKGEAIFYALQSFTVSAAKTTYLTVAVPMVNFGVRFSLPEDFTTIFSSYEFSVSLGGRSVILNDGETAYFSLPSEESSDGSALEYSLTAVNKDSESFTKSLSYDGTLASGTIYQVTYSFATKSLSSAPSVQ